MQQCCDNKLMKADKIQLKKRLLESPDTPWSKPGRGGREAPALEDSESAFKASPPPHPPPNQLARELTQASLDTKQTGALATGRESPARSEVSLARPARPVEPSSVRRQEGAMPPLHL